MIFLEINQICFEINHFFDFTRARLSHVSCFFLHEPPVWMKTLFHPQPMGKGSSLMFHRTGEDGVFFSSKVPRAYGASEYVFLFDPKVPFHMDT